MEIKTKFNLGDTVFVQKNDETFMAVIDTVSSMHFKLSDNKPVTDITYIGVDGSGDRIVFNESECYAEEFVTLK